MGSVSEMLAVVPLHQRPDLLESCADLINEEWKRSRTSRIHSLQRSTNDFPICLVLIRTPRAEEEVTEEKLAKNQCQLLGHARLSRVVGHPKSLFVETVVVPKAIRGKGYGRKLMEAVESYAKARGYSHLHLTTHDKQHFYAHLGYTLSKPVQCAGFVSSLIPLEFLESLSPSQHARSGKNNPGASNGSKAGANLCPLPPSVPSFSSSLSSVAPPPPSLPPPPLYPACSPDSVDVTISSSPQLAASSHSSFSQPINATIQPSQSPSVSLFANSFSAATAPPPPPPLPPPPPPSELPPVTHLPGLPSSCKSAASCPPEDKSQNQMFLETPYHDLKGQPIFWMEKDI